MTNYRAVCATQAASSLVAGVVLLLFPVVLLGPLGLPTEVGTQVVARILGGVLFALGATLIGAREATDGPTVLRVTVGNLVCDASVALLITSATVSGALGPLGYGLAALFASNAVSWLVSLRAARGGQGQ